MVGAPKNEQFPVKAELYRNTTLAYLVANQASY